VISVMEAPQLGQGWPSPTVSYPRVTLESVHHGHQRSQSVLL